VAEHNLRRGDLVEVRSAAEILATLDARGALEGMPFMPEMVTYCGRRLTVDRRADKVCDTIHYSGSRRPDNTVLLDDLRCDGAAHGGCQAECRPYWKEAWLKRVTAGTARSNLGADEARQALLQRTKANARTDSDDGEIRFRCQATEILSASEPLNFKDPRPYLREVTTGNVSIRSFTRVMARATVMEAKSRVGRLPEPPVVGAASTSPASEPLNLQPGDWVRVRSREQIASTLNDKGKNRGLWFDREMLAFCGHVFRVRRRITRLVDERTGSMIDLSSDCVSLEGVVCSGERSLGRWFCPRAIYPYWRECWLERVDKPDVASVRMVG
jgi:hypothetical protein